MIVLIVGSIGPVIYKAFISYSHAADGRLAPALQSALHRFAKPWYRLRAMRVFRDKTNLAANPGLWSTIQAALDESEFFLLLASPESASSKWVRKEVDYWLQTKSPERFLIVLTDGSFVWEDKAENPDTGRTASALPPELVGRFKEEPLIVDLSWAKRRENLSLRDSEFRNAALDLAATLHGKPKDELGGEDVRQHRKTVRLAWSAGIILLLLSIATSLAAYVAVQQRNSAFSRELAVTAVAKIAEDPELSVLIAAEAARVKPTVQAEDALRRSMLASRIRLILRGHTDSVNAVAFSPDGQWIATASQDKSARIWEMRCRASRPHQSDQRTGLQS